MSVYTCVHFQTYNTDNQTPDSAGSATAFWTGEKTRSDIVGLNQHAILGNCSSAKGNELKSMLKDAIDSGRKYIISSLQYDNDMIS